jgi:hypothetical protein
MKLRRIGAVALGCLLVSFAAPVAESDPSRSAPMQFSLRQDATGCGIKCKTWVAATGMIRAETAREFELFATKHNIRGSTIVLNSEGGSVHGAIALGRAIRKLDMTTTVGRTVNVKGAADPRIGNIVSRADCESMCAFVLLSGAKRIVPPEARVRVHQIWLGDRRDDAAAASYSAEDLVLVQRDIGKLAQYTIEMGGSVELLEISLRIPPWEPMRVLSRDEMRRMNLDNSDVTDARSTPPQSTASAAPAQLPAKRVAFGGQRDRERGWVMAENAGSTTLTRRHPLTVEGEDIGSIDVTFACGGQTGEYVVLYNETRRTTEGVAAQPLKSVELRLANRTIPLTLGVSRPAQKPGEHLSTASGAVTGAMLHNFAGVGLRSMVIESMVEDADPAVIRIGNTGVTANITQFLASCAQPGAAQPADASAEHAELKTDAQ